MPSVYFSELMQYKCHPGQFCVYSWFNARCLLKDCYIRAQRTWVIQHINQWERYWISSADEIQLQSFYYTGRQRFKGCQTDIRCYRWSLVSVSGLPLPPPSSAWGSQMPVCPRESSERSCPWREPGHDGDSVNFSVIFHSKISLVRKSHSHCYKLSAITLL